MVTQVRSFLSFSSYLISKQFQHFVISREERKFDNSDKFGEKDNPCSQIMQATNTTIEIFTGKDQNLAFLVCGKLPDVNEARRRIIASFQTPVWPGFGLGFKFTAVFSTRWRSTSRKSTVGRFWARRGKICRSGRAPLLVRSGSPIRIPVPTLLSFLGLAATSRKLCMKSKSRMTKWWVEIWLVILLVGLVACFDKVLFEILSEID